MYVCVKNTKALVEVAEPITKLTIRQRSMR